MMKKFIPLIVLFLGLGQKLIAQAAMVDGAYTLVEQMPQYPGGADSLLAHVMARVVYPQACADSGIQGKVYLRFIVDEKGSVTNVEAIKGPHPLLKKAAEEAVTGLTGFTPGTEKGKSVKVWYSLPVNFKVVTQADDIANKDDEMGPVMDKNFTLIETWPEFPGGDSALLKNLAYNIQYPVLERDNDIDGKVLISFMVDTDGAVVDPVVMRGVTDGLNKEAIRVIRQLPKFKPATQNGKPVPCYFNMPIVFRLEPKAHYDSKEDILRDFYNQSAKYIKGNLRYPDWALLQKQQAVSVVQFKFNNKGEAVPIKVLNPIDSTFDNEAMRVISNLPASTECARIQQILTDTFAMRVEFRLDTSVAYYIGGNYLKGEPSINYHNEIGVKYYAQRDFSKALQNFKMASLLDGNALHNMALCYWMMYDFKEAKKMFNKSYLAGDLDAITAIRKLDKIIAEDKASVERLDSILKHDHAPQYERGDAALMWLLTDNIKYPQMERDNDIQGTVVVVLTIDEEGKALNPHIIQSVSRGLDAEALRVVSLIKKMIPAKRNGKVVQEELKIPVTFKLI